MSSASCEIILVYTFLGTIVRVTQMLIRQAHALDNLTLRFVYAHARTLTEQYLMNNASTCSYSLIETILGVSRFTVSTMKIVSSILLCTVSMITSATPWYNNPYKARAQKTGYFDSQGYYHRAAETTMIHEDFPATQQAANRGSVLSSDASTLNFTCQSASYISRRVSTYLHICELGGSSGELR